MKEFPYGAIPQPAIFGLPYTSITNRKILGGSLGRLDTLVFPHPAPHEIVNGHGAGSMPDQFTGGAVWEVPEGSQARVLLRFPAKDLLASGWLVGKETIAGKAATVEIPFRWARDGLFCSACARSTADKAA